MLSADVARLRQERRLAQLNDDNAFVDVQAVLGTDHHTTRDAANEGSSRATASSAAGSRGATLLAGQTDYATTFTSPTSRSTVADDPNAPFLDESHLALRKRPRSRTAGPLFLRVPLSASLAEQHREWQAKLAALDAEQRRGKEDDELESKDTTRRESAGDSNEVVPQLKVERQRRRRAGAKRSRTGETTRREVAARGAVEAEHNNEEKSNAAVRVRGSYSNSDNRNILCAFASGAGTRVRADVVAAEAAAERSLLRAWKAAMELTTLPFLDDENATGEDMTKGGEEALTVSPAELELYCSCPSFHAMTARRLDTTRRKSAMVDHGGKIQGSADETAQQDVTPFIDACSTLHLCSVCMLPARYRCVRCRTALFCSIPCHAIHDATRCLKFIV